MPLEIIYQDHDLVAINKPHGLLVHRSKYADEVNIFAVQELRNQLGQHVYPCHRLDRKTSGVLLFALNSETNALIQEKFTNSLLSKKYIAIVRGFSPEEGLIDYALTNDNGKVQNAVTHYKTIKQTEVNIPLGKFQTSRYSLIEAYPKTGRLHQIRKHFAHIFHPIIADRPHGCNKQNRLFKEKWGMDTMMLHANVLEFEHPHRLEKIKIIAEPSLEFKRVLKLLNF